MSEKVKFYINENHLKLLNRTNIDWCDDEFGAPCIDPKRPYGNSDVMGDLAEILGVEYPISNADEEFLRNIYREMQTVLQILVLNATIGISIGWYCCEKYKYHTWKREE